MYKATETTLKRNDVISLIFFKERVGIKTFIDPHIRRSLSYLFFNSLTNVLLFVNFLRWILACYNRT